MHDVARSLPIYQHESELLAAVRDHSVVIVDGPTGCGKTTQLPRILLRGIDLNGAIGVTQPRRIAAVSVARRIAAEEGVTLGEQVGYAIRFEDVTCPATQLKVMTDGILLQEARNDPDFSRYSVIMVDEAHERSLNIDLCLGLLFQALERRADLKVIVSSATMRPETFQEFFETLGRRVAAVSIKSRVFSIETTYQPLRRTRWADIAQAVADEVIHIHSEHEPGHVLVFLSGEGMIHQTRNEIEALHSGPDLLVLPLYGRLTREEQERVFDEYRGRRKCVLATNIAETSITIPDVRYVIDTGLAKVPRYHETTGLMSLQEEMISRASAEQRAGRAGRTAPGVVVRLYDKKHLLAQPEFTEEEIRRLDLSEVVLRLIDLGVHQVERFRFPAPPSKRSLRRALGRLRMMGAIDKERALTQTGRRMVPYPLSPSLARMVVEASHRFPDVTEEVLIVGAFLSVRAPFLFPPGEEAEARRIQRNQSHPLGDALTAVKTLQAYRRAKDKARFCLNEYLDPQVMAFIEKSVGQLREIAESMGVQVGSGGEPELVTRCLATGFPELVLIRRGNHYQTVDGTKVMLHPSSGLFHTGHQLLIAPDIVITARAYARHASVLRSEWLHEINPEAAECWFSGRRRPKRQPPKTGKPVVPKSLDVGGVKLPVRRRKHPLIDVPLKEVAKLRSMSSFDLENDSARWQSRIVTDQGCFSKGTPLRRLLALLPILPLPVEGQVIEMNPLEGALLSIEHNWESISGLFSQLMQPMRPQSGKWLGWLAFVSNGMGEYWVEVMPEYQSALQTTLVSLEALRDEVSDKDGEGPASLEQIIERIVEMSKALLQG